MNFDLVKVSILIPVYNVEKYIEESLLSVINQTHTNLEIIVVDDRSTDRTFQIVKKIAETDSRIKLYQNSQNKQISYTLNKAFGNSTGEFIARLDGDDYFSINRVATMLKFLKNNNQYDIVGTSMTTISESGDIIGKSKCFQDVDILKKIIKYSLPMAHIWMARRVVYKDLNGYREIVGCEDDDFILRADSLSFNYTNIEDDYSYYVRLGRGSNSNDLLGLRKIKMRKYVYKLHLERGKCNAQDSFSASSLERSIQSGRILSYLHSKSNIFLYKAIQYKGSNFFLLSGIYLALSCISIYQIQYLYERIMIRLIGNRLFSKRLKND
jgi:glycosyltransferase involved in cell wall biosynthesis